MPLGRLLWQDMLVYGSTINVAATLLSLLLLAWGAPTALAVTVHFAPLPYNLFLFAAVWKSAAGAEEPWVSIARIVALLWLIASIII